MYPLSLFKKDKPHALRLDGLPDDVLEEVVRQSEAMLSSQFQAHLGLMTRGFTMAGFLLTAATAVIATSVNLSGRSAASAGLSLGSTSAVFAMLLIVASIMAFLSAIPRRFSVPGLEPYCWNLEYWRLPPKHEPDLRKARLSYLSVMQSQIFKNRRSNFAKAALQLGSFLLAVCALVFAFIAHAA